MKLICVKCNISKHESEFYKGSNKYGKDNLCKDCRRKQSKARRDLERERINIAKLLYQVDYEYYVELRKQLEGM